MSACIIWTDALSGAGYGVMRVGAKLRYARAWKAAYKARKKAEAA